MREPVLANLPTYEWDADRSADLAAATEAINQAIGAYTALIARARAGGNADQVPALVQARADCAAARRALRSADHAAVTRAVQHYRALATHLQDQNR